MQQGKVTIGIPTFNRAHYLEKTLKSVTNQSYSNIEIIISDNASEDNTIEVVEDYLQRNRRRVKYFCNEENIGMRENWNRLLDLAQGEFFLLLSDDDLLSDDAIEKLINPFYKDHIVLVHSAFEIIDSIGDVTGINIQDIPEIESGKDFIIESFRHNRYVLPSSTLFKTEAARKLGGFPDLDTATDLGLRLLLAERGKVAYVSDPVMKYRRHNQSLSQSAHTQIITAQKLLVQFMNEHQELQAFKFYAKKYATDILIGRAIVQDSNNNSKLSRLFLKESFSIQINLKMLLRYFQEKVTRSFDVS